MLVINQIEDIRKAYKKAKALDSEFHRVFRGNQDAQDLGMRPLRAPSFLQFTRSGMTALVTSTEEGNYNVRPKDCQSRMAQYAKLFIPDAQGETEYSPYLPNASLCVYVGDGVGIGLPDGLTRGKTVCQVLSQPNAPDGLLLPVLFVDDEQLELIRKYADSARTRDMLLRVELALKRGKPLNGFEKQIVCRAIKTALSGEQGEHGGRGVFTPDEIEKAVPKYRDFFLTFLDTKKFSDESINDPKVKLLRSASGMAAIAHVFKADREAGEKLLRGIDNAISGNCSNPNVSRLWSWIGGRRVQSTDEKETLFRAITYIGKMIIIGAKLADDDNVCKLRNYLLDDDLGLKLK